MLISYQGYENQFDQYKYVRKLGDGAASLVILAQHRSTHEQFAIKVIKFRAQDLTKQMKINLEIELHSRCKNSTQIVRYKEQFSQGEDHYIVMEHMPGGDL